MVTVRRLAENTVLEVRWSSIDSAQIQVQSYDIEYRITLLDKADVQFPSTSINFPIASGDLVLNISNIDGGTSYEARVRGNAVKYTSGNDDILMFEITNGTWSGWVPSEIKIPTS